MKKKSLVSLHSPFPAFLLILAASLTAQSTSLFRQFSSFKAVGGVVSDGTNLWLATSGGAVKYNPASGTTKVFADLADLPDLNLVDAVRDKSGDVWFGSAEGYLVRLHPATETFTTYNALAATGWPITCLLNFENNIFIGSSDGLSIFSIDKGSVQNVKLFGTFTSVDVSALRSYGDTLALITSDGIAYCVVHDVGSTIFSDPALWNCVPAAGALGIIHANDSLKASYAKILQTGTVTWQYGVNGDLLINGTKAASFSSPITCVLQFNANSFVVGTQASFFWIYDGTKMNYSQITVDGPSDSRIEDCVMDQTGYLWYVPFSLGDGIGRFDGSSWAQLTYKTNPDLGSMSSGMLTGRNTIMTTSKNDIWVSSFADGVKWLNRATGAWTSFEDPYGAQPHANALNPKPPLYVPSPLTRFSPDTAGGWWTLISGSCEDSLGNIWVANYVPYTGGAILNVRKPRENTWRSFTFGDSTYKLLSPYTGPVAANADKTNGIQYIYLGYVHNEAQTGGGLSVLSYSSSADPFTGPVSCVNGTITVSVSDIAVANDTLVWIAGGDGIYRMTRNDPSTITKITRIISSDGLMAVAAGYDGRAVFCKDRDLYTYKDGDTTLTQVTNTAKFGPSVNSIFLDKKNSVYWVGSNKGLFRFDTGDSTAATPGHPVDVYPNPVSSMHLRSGHAVKFAGLDFSNPTVRIFDAGGALVISISEQNTKVVAWSGTNLSGKVVIPGIYFYQAAVGGGKYAKGRIFVIP
jgi:streptogramin lyase